MCWFWRLVYLYKPDESIQGKSRFVCLFLFTVFFLWNCHWHVSFPSSVITMITPYSYTSQINWNTCISLFLSRMLNSSFNPCINIDMSNIIKLNLFVVISSCILHIPPHFVSSISMATQCYTKKHILRSIRF